ncbi:hypothetical protein KCP70_24420 [Salmonella enterica subsp. enterica]|nr:hypothetical protein KCP70_24420 [Salmonella enterica subsp. enterica]
MSVTRTPPNLSEITPPADRAQRRIKGPKNASRECLRREIAFWRAGETAESR